MTKADNTAGRAQEEHWIRSMESHGIKPTAMRLLVCRELERARHPLSLRDLEERMVTAERSTIFRALTLLHEHRLIHAIEDGSGAMKYELCHSEGAGTTDEDQHPHFYCEQCRRTYCLHDAPLPQVPLPPGFHAVAANLLIKGICAECRGIVK
ncbi:MAG: transcriptional repressor [Bacteroidaceae bacterium]|nr:transcriptional repressor [Bacteroidaceae bacterium]